MTRIFSVQLRTSDVEAARAFYATLLGEGALKVVELHEQAVARGARPHWLGFLDVDDVARTAAALVQRGAVALGPKWVNPEGLEASVLRDPGGAIVAVARPPTPARVDAGWPDVSWRLLHTADVERAKANHHELFGWDFLPPVDRGELGVFHPFAWQRGGAAVGAFADVAARPTVHPHWLFHFRVPALDAALDVVRASGGTVLQAVTLPDGQRVAACDDPQGAAFALHQVSAGG